MLDEPKGNFRLIVVSEGLTEAKLKQDPLLMLQSELILDLEKFNDVTYLPYTPAKWKET
jgi:hypothetical protein